MNSRSMMFALIATAAAALASAQTQPPPNMQSQNPSAAPAGQSSSQPHAPLSTADENRAIKECIEQQRSTNNGMSVAELKDLCRQRVDHPSSTSPH